MLKTRESIQNWLQEYGVEDYEIVRYDTALAQDTGGWLVNTEGAVSLDHKNLKALPVQFNHVAGSFRCSGNKLQSLKGVPKLIDRSFSCTLNELTTLEFGPKKVGIDYFCGNNRLENLKFAPPVVGGDFLCNDNQLKTLKYAPKIVGGIFVCSNNLLANLEFVPERIAGHLNFENNLVIDLYYFPSFVGGQVIAVGNKELGAIQELVNFNDAYAEHVKVRIEKEKALLAGSIQVPIVYKKSAPIKV